MAFQAQVAPEMGKVLLRCLVVSGLGEPFLLCNSLSVPPVAWWSLGCLFLSPSLVSGPGNMFPLVARMKVGVQQ